MIYSCGIQVIYKHGILFLKGDKIHKKEIKKIKNLITIVSITKNQGFGETTLDIVSY